MQMHKLEEGMTKIILQAGNSRFAVYFSYSYSKKMFTRLKKIIQDTSHASQQG